MSLQKEITAHASKIYRESYQMSISELIHLYRDGEMDIHPEFQLNTHSTNHCYMETYVTMQQWFSYFRFFLWPT